VPLSSFPPDQQPAESELFADGVSLKPHTIRRPLF
jgi:hypothetical protein